MTAFWLRLRTITLQACSSWLCPPDMIQIALTWRQWRILPAEERTNHWKKTQLFWCSYSAHSTLSKKPSRPRISVLMVWLFLNNPMQLSRSVPVSCRVPAACLFPVPVRHLFSLPPGLSELFLWTNLISFPLDVFGSLTRAWNTSWLQLYRFQLCLRLVPI